MTVKEANEVLVQTKACIEKFNSGERKRVDCFLHKCDDCKWTLTKESEARQMAIRSLEAWEKVIEEIEQLRAKFKESGGVYEHSAYGLDYATEIINKHLSEVEK